MVDSVKIPPSVVPPPRQDSGLKPVEEGQPDKLELNKLDLTGPSLSYKIDLKPQLTSGKQFVSASIRQTAVNQTRTIPTNDSKGGGAVTNS